MTSSETQPPARKRRLAGALGLLAALATYHAVPATPLPPAPDPATAVDTAIFAVG